MPKTIKQNRAVGAAAETAARKDLEAAGYAVDDLNEIAPNCPCADFVARKGSCRLLVQVRGTATRAGWFRVRLEETDRFTKLAIALGCRPIYAFVQVDGSWPTIRFGMAEDVRDAVIDSFIAGDSKGSTWTTLLVSRSGVDDVMGCSDDL